MFAIFNANLFAIIDIEYIEVNFAQGEKKLLDEILKEILYQLEDTIPILKLNVELEGSR